jgi:hypothetical protein
VRHWVGLDGDGVELTQARLDRIATGADADESDDLALALGHPPSPGTGGQFSGPASDLIGVERSHPEEPAEAAVPRVDVDAGDSTR